MKKIVTGITGQDGPYLTQFLLDTSYQVFGTCRHSRSVNFWRIDELAVTSHPMMLLVGYDLTGLHWQPSTALEQLCQMLVGADLRRNSAGFSF